MCNKISTEWTKYNSHRVGRCNAEKVEYAICEGIMVQYEIGAKVLLDREPKKE
jgi:hypothetical protein